MKKALEFYQMVDYLEGNKNVVFENINKEDAVKILKVHGYYNVITPFKYYFADRNKDDKSQLLKIDGRHQYSKQHDFEKWYLKFVEERETYPVIYKNVISIKTTFKNIMFNKIYCKYKFENNKELQEFFSMDCRTNAMNRYDFNEMKYINKSLDHLVKEVEERYSIYYLVGNIGFGDCNNLFRSLDINLQKEIIYELQNIGIAPRPTNAEEFYYRMVKIQKIRNCIMHNDSLEVLFRYELRNRNKARENRDRLSYKKICQEFIV